jgi:hypothetical protein
LRIIVPYLASSTTNELSTLKPQSALASQAPALSSDEKQVSFGDCHILSCELRANERTPDNARLSEQKSRTVVSDFRCPFATWATFSGASSPVARLH